MLHWTRGPREIEAEWGAVVAGQVCENCCMCVCGWLGGVPLLLEQSDGMKCLKSHRLQWDLVHQHCPMGKEQEWSSFTVNRPTGSHKHPSHCTAKHPYGTLTLCTCRTCACTDSLEQWHILQTFPLHKHMFFLSSIVLLFRHLGNQLCLFASCLT